MPDGFIRSLPDVNACFNTLSTLLLVAGWLLIRRGRRNAHVACMVGALASSAFFLAGYLVYHYHHGSTRFPDIPVVRPVYLGILLTHTVLAMAIVPMIAATVFHALKGRFDRHRRIARVTLPAWLYVSVTGVVIYAMLYHLYPAR